ncbi:AraC family transcriptional regulator [Paenibacillus polysaccharolyticus]|uniref:AraC family transcriptional regulator n=1 Tax=Paenibacillus polysaccharolyticus TaxID=582692 RepID=UPI00203AA05B|nr:AraC family transcriptional regulator [Paenibacillus polysaccharolyticus]MCM3135943.1 AraC family transcriptional regulator [Paenibacillus polysaccharolyticus]
MSRKVEMNVVSAGWTQMELVLLFYGWEACDPAHYWGPGVRDSYIVHYVHEGRGTVYMGDREYPLSEGQGFLILPDTVIHYEADAHEPWTYSWFGFRGVQAKAFMQRAQLSEEHPVFTAHDKHMMAVLYDEMLQAGTSSVAGGDVLHQSLLYRLMAALIASSPIKEEENPLLSTKETYIRQAVQFMENRYSQRTSILDIAQAVGLDRTYLSGLFKERYGKSLQAFFLEYRMNRAAELLRNPMLSVSEVAHSVGYTDPLLFSKMFKRVTGVSPKGSRVRD